MGEKHIFDDRCKYSTFSKNGIDYFGEYHVEYDNSKTMAGLGVLKRHKENSIEMHEDCIMKSVSGATVYADPQGKEILLGFSKDSAPLGPQFVYNKNDVCCLKCVNKTLGILNFVVYLYPSGIYDVYLYDNKGNFTGKGITFDGTKLCFTKSKQLFESEKTSPLSDKYDFKHLFFEQGNLEVHDFSYKKYHGPLTYTVSGGDVNFIDAAQYEDVYGKLGATVDLNNNLYVNRTIKGYGYRKTSNGFTLGYIDRYKDFDVRTLPFQGVCIRKFDDGGYYLGNFSYGKYNGLALSRKGNDYGLGTYKNGVKNGVFFDILNENLYIRKYRDGKIKGNQIKIQSGSFLAYILDENNNQIDSIFYPFSIEDNYITEENSNKDMDAIRDQLDFYTLEALKDYTFTDIVTHKEEDFGYSTRQAPVHIITITGVKNPSKEMEIPNCVNYIEKGTFESPGCEIIKKIVYRGKPSNVILAKSFGPLPGVKEFLILNKISDVKKDAFYCESIEYMDLSNCKTIRTGAFTNCKNLKKVLVNFYSEIEKGAFPPGCVVVYKGAYQADNIKQFFKNLPNLFSSKRRKRSDELKDSAKQKVKELKEQRKAKELEEKENQKKLKEEENKKKVKEKGSKKTKTPKEKKVKVKKARKKISFNLGDVCKSILSVLASPFILIGKFFAMLGKGIWSFIKGFFGLFSEIDFGAILESPMTWIPSIILIVCAIINITGLHGSIDNLLSEGLSSYSTLFGLHLSGLGAEWLDNLDKSNILVIVTGLILVVLVLIFFVLDLIINVLLLLGLILYFLFYLIFGIAYVFVLPIAMLILFIIGFLKDRDNGANLILLALNIIFIVVFYIPFL